MKRPLSNCFDFMAIWLANLPSRQYKRLLFAWWLWATLILMVIGNGFNISFFIGAVSQIPFSWVLGRVEFGSWDFSI